MIRCKVSYKTYIANDAWLIRLKQTHKQKGKTMWVKTVDNNLVNMKHVTRIFADKGENGYDVMVRSGFGHSILKSFKYKEDAEKYLEELMGELNGQD